MNYQNHVRIDKWLWAVRIYKTRNQATDACRKGKILIEGNPVKPSRSVKLDEIILIRKNPVIHTYKIKGIIEKRVSAKFAEENYENLTTAEELNKLKHFDSFFIKRDKGTGRPTKRERRLMNKYRDSD